MKKENLEGYEKYIYEAESILKNKIISDNSINVNVVEKIREKLDIALYFNGKSTYKLEVLYGKIDLLSGDNKMALEHFKNAIKYFEESDKDKCFEPIAAYYGMFRAYVSLKDYEEALNSLIQYNSCFKDDLNIEFYFKALCKLLELQGKKVSKSAKVMSKEGYINCYKVPDETLGQYKKVESYFESKEYGKAYKKLLKFQEACKLKNLGINVKPLIIILKEISLLEEKKLKEDSVKEDAKKYTDIDELKNFLKYEILEFNSVSAIIELVKILIKENNYQEAYIWLNHKMNPKTKEKYIKELNELRKIVYEECDLINNKDKIDSYLSQANMFLLNNDYLKAIKVYKQALEKLRSPIFLYKIAEAYYNIGNMGTAKKYFINYLSFAQKYKIECYIYLHYIELICNKNAVSSKYGKLLLTLSSLDEYGDVIENAKNGYDKFVEKKDTVLFENKDEKFNKYYKKIISLIKSGDRFVVERINQDKMVPEDFQLIKIGSAIALLENGDNDLAESYYKSAKNFSDKDEIYDLIQKYKRLKKRKQKETKF